MMKSPTEWKVIKLYKIHVPNHQPDPVPMFQAFETWTVCLSESQAHGVQFAMDAGGIVHDCLASNGNTK